MAWWPEHSALLRELAAADGDADAAAAHLDEALTPTGWPAADVHALLAALRGAPGCLPVALISPRSALAGLDAAQLRRAWAYAEYLALPTAVSRRVVVECAYRA
jgi:hypothetical protein